MARTRRGARTVILVHGLWMTGLEMRWLGRGLRRASGGRVLTFHYPSVRAGLVENAARLAAFCREVGTRDGEEPHLVGHSLGGLVIWRMFRDFPPTPGPRESGNAARVVTLGTPFGGCRAAQFLRARGGKPGRWLLGANYRVEADVWPAERAWKAPRALGILAGDQAFGPAHLLGVLPAPNDGIIALDETPLHGAADYRVVRANHVSLTFSAEAIRQTAHFLAHGRFAPRAADPWRRE